MTIEGQSWGSQWNETDLTVSAWKFTIAVLQHYIQSVALPHPWIPACAGMTEGGVEVLYHVHDISTTVESETKTGSWLSQAHEHKEREKNPRAASPEGSLPTHGIR